MEEFYNKGELIYVLGYTGSGKTTLLKSLKKELGDRAGYVMQNPDNQIVTDKVYSELPENTAEIASYFGISKWLRRNTGDLSGGEKQILCIAAVMAAKPEILLIDEPTSMLDPIATARVRDLIVKLNRDLRITIIVAGHKPDEFIDAADRIAVIEAGKIMFIDTPIKTAEYLIKHELTELAPAVSRIFAGYDDIPVTLRDGITRLETIKNIDTHIDFTRKRSQNELALTCKNVRYSYDKYGEAILSNLNLEARKDEILAILGENGSGKTTLAYLLAGIRKPYSGSVHSSGKVGFLCQDVTNHFTEDEYDGINPYELSGGEQQKLALDLVLKEKVDILILDEPTKGLDGREKKYLVERLKELNEGGVTIIIVTHDIEFAADTCDRVCLLFDGQITGLDDTHEFFKNTYMYQTTAGKLFRNINDNVITVDEARSCL